jgi:hypothetical protein
MDKVIIFCYKHVDMLYWKIVGRGLMRHRNKQGAKMKTRSMIVGVLLMVLNAGATTQYRDFMDTKGRTIRARILSYEARTQKVKIERDNGSAATVPISIFSDEDQKFIEKWLQHEGVRSAAKLKVICARKNVKSWNKERLGTINYTGGESEHNQVVGKTDYDEIAYEIEFNNRNKYPLKGLTLEYCIYYEQEISPRDENPRPGVLHDSASLAEIAGQSKFKFSTKSVTIFKDESDSSFLNARVLKGKVLGIIYRLSVKEGDKELLLRSESYPKNLMKSVVWSEHSKTVGGK